MRGVGKDKKHMIWVCMTCVVCVCVCSGAIISGEKDKLVVRLIHFDGIVNVEKKEAPHTRFKSPEQPKSSFIHLFKLDATT